MTIETKYNVGDVHQLKASVGEDGYVTITGKVLEFNRPQRIDWFVESIDPNAYNNTDLAHAFAETVWHGRRFTLAHAYTEGNTLSFQIKTDGLYFTIRAFVDLTFFIDSLNESEQWEVGYSYLTAPMGSEWSVGEDGLDHRLVKNVERLYSISIRQPNDSKVNVDDTTDMQIVQKQGEK